MRTQCSEENLDGAYGLPGVNMSLQGDSLFDRGLLSESVVDVEQIISHRLNMRMLLDI